MHAQESVCGGCGKPISDRYRLALAAMWNEVQGQEQAIVGVEEEALGLDEMAKMFVAGPGLCLDDLRVVQEEHGARPKDRDLALRWRWFHARYRPGTLVGPGTLVSPDRKDELEEVLWKGWGHADAECEDLVAV